MQCSRCRTKGLDCHFERPPFIYPVNSSLPFNRVESVLDIGTSSVLKTKGNDVDYLAPAYEAVEIEPDGFSLPDRCDDYSDGHSSAITLLHQSTSSTFAMNLWTENIDASGHEDAMTDAIVFDPHMPEAFLYGEACSPPRYSIFDGAFIPRQLSLKPLKSFSPIRERDLELQLTTRYIACAIKSYPNMLLERKLPPFIHHSCLTKTPDLSLDISLPGPLSVCASIVQMFNFKNSSNTAFIWKTIRMEQERLAAEVFHFFRPLETSTDEGIVSFL